MFGQKELRVAEKTIVRTESAPAPFQGAPYSQAIRAGEFIFVSGQLALRNSARLSVIRELEERVKELEAKVLVLEAHERELITEKLTLMERLLGVTYRSPVSP